MLCFSLGFQEYLLHSFKYKSFSRQYSLTWTKTLRFNWTIKLVFSSFICGSLIRHRHTSFSQFEMLKDFSLPALSHFGSRFKLSSFSPPRGIVTSLLPSPPPPFLLRQIDKPQGGLLLQRVTQMFAEGKHILRGWSRLLQSSERGFMTLFCSWMEYSVHLRGLSLNWHV